MDSPRQPRTLRRPISALVVTPKEGAATCRIEVEKKEVAKVQGQPGAPVTCTATVKDPR
jgi:hypothetical protein